MIILVYSPATDRWSQYPVKLELLKWSSEIKYCIDINTWIDLMRHKSLYTHIPPTVINPQPCTKTAKLLHQHICNSEYILPKVSASAHLQLPECEITIGISVSRQSLFRTYDVSRNYTEQSMLCDLKKIFIAKELSEHPHNFQTWGWKHEIFKAFQRMP